MATGRPNSHIRRGKATAINTDSPSGTPKIRRRSGGNQPGVTQRDVEGRPVTRRQGGKSEDAVFDQNG